MKHVLLKIIEGNNEILNIELNQNKVTKFDPKDEFYLLLIFFCINHHFLKITLPHTQILLI
jgi:hypothetical protein